MAAAEMAREREEEEHRVRRRKRRRGGSVEGKKASRRIDRRARGGMLAVKPPHAGLKPAARAGETKATSPLAEAKNPLDPMARKEGGHVPFRTESGSVSAAGRKEAQNKGETMPGGRFPIRNAQDLSNAKHDLGRAKGDKGAVRRWINKRARELGEPGLGG